MFRKIKNYDYAVSCVGQVKNLKTGKILKNSKDANGYACVNLFKNKKANKLYVHRLVAEYFLENPESKPQVAHIDGDGMNPNIFNLRWSTQAQNEQDKKAHGRYNKNPYGGQIFNKNDLLEIDNLHKQGLSFRKIAKIKNTSHGTISGIINERTYKNLR